MVSRFVLAAFAAACVLACFGAKCKAADTPPVIVLAPQPVPQACANANTGGCRTPPAARPLAAGISTVLAAEPLAMGAPVRTFLGLGGRCGFLKHRRGKC